MVTKSRKRENTEQLSRQDVLSEFVYTLNLVQPTHPYQNDNIYPLDKNDINFGYKTSSGPYYASCGPTNNKRKPVIFKIDLNAFNRFSVGRRLSVYIHEMTHITVGSHSNKEAGSHPPRFWREFAFNCHVCIENWSQIKDYFDQKSESEDGVEACELVGYVFKDEVNRFNLDKRYFDVPEMKQQMARWFESTLKSEQ